MIDICHFGGEIEKRLEWGNKRGQNELKKRLELGHNRDQMEIRMRSLRGQNEIINRSE